jgi:hypothetical protein
VALHFDIGDYALIGKYPDRKEDVHWFGKGVGSHDTVLDGVPGQLRHFAHSKAYTTLRDARVGIQIVYDVNNECARRRVFDYFSD